MKVPSYRPPGVPALLATLVLASLPARASAREHFGDHRATLVGLRAPQAVAFDAEGRVLVADTGNHRVVVFDASGARRATWERPDAYARPAGIAVGRDGRVYVADTGNHRVLVHDRDGRPLLAFGERGVGPGELCEPRGLAVDARRVLVCDAGNARVCVFDLEGSFVDTLAASGEPALRRPVDVALDALGRAHVVDELACAVLLIGADGSVLGASGERGAPFGLFAAPAGIDVTGGRLFVSDRWNHRVQELDLTGSFTATFPGPAFAPRDDEGRLFAPAGLAVSPAGDLVAVAEPLEDRVQLFGEHPPGEGSTAHADHPGIEDSLARVGSGAGGDGSLLAVVDPETRTVGVFDCTHVEPVPITRLGARGGMGVALEEPRDAALDPARGWVHVSDAGTGRVWAFALRRDPDDPLRYDAQMGEVARFVDLRSAFPGGDPESALTWPAEPGALTCAADGTLYVADERNRAVIVVAPSGRPLGALEAIGGRALLSPVDLALSPDGARIHVADAGHGVVLISGVRGGTFAPLRAAGDPALVEPAGVLPLSDGRVLVSDRGGDRVHVFDARGRRVATWGSPGGGASELRQPAGLAPAPEGMLYLLDPGNRRGQLLTVEGRFVLSF